MVRTIRAAVVTFVAAAAILCIAAPGWAGPEAGEAQRNAANAGTVGVVSGGVDGTYVRIAADLAAVLDDGDRLRVLPILGKGSVRNLLDIKYVRGVDIGIVQSDVLAYAKRERLYQGLDRSISYIAKLYDEELHILAGERVASVADLAGKKINVDVKGSGTSITMSLLLERLGIAAQETNFDQALALEKLKQGEIDALAYVAGKPARLFRDITPAQKLHFLAVPATPALLETYLPAQLSPEDYPGLLAEGTPVETVAVGAVMAVYNWPREGERYRKVARFVDAFFDKFDSFLAPPRHQKWKEVNLAAQVPGWTRFPAAEQRLKRDLAQSGGTTRKEFEAFLAAAGGTTQAVDEAQKSAMFEEFLRWQEQRRRQAR